MEHTLRNVILPSAYSNLSQFYKCNKLPDWAKQSIDELVEQEQYTEINNRFYKTLEFGTGGMRSRTIAEHLTKAELGNSATNIPEFASVGTAYLNDFNIIGATIALFRYCRQYLNNFDKQHELPSVVIAYDVRHFSEHFCKLAASIWQKLGGHAMIFPAPRSTPQLSFSVRHLQSTAGIMITASHNPWHDNGFKAYFSDGAQMVDPHASGVIKEFNAITIDEICSHYSHTESKFVILNNTIDDCYQTTVSNTILNKTLLNSYPIHAVFSPLHGTGGVATIPLLNKLNIKHTVVEEQSIQDPNFSTVKSPNPENNEALTMSISYAEKVDADIILATDPDGDRLAVAAKNTNGRFEIFTGNVTGALLADYRILQLKAMNMIPNNGTQHAAIIKTFVTSPLLDKIASTHGIKCINTLTGFKWIGDKMLDYETIMLNKVMETSGMSLNYSSTNHNTRFNLLQQHSTAYIFGCEESYGCLACDDIRDKDANSACLMACELASYAKSMKKTLCQLRDEMYMKYGYFGESVMNIYYEGANGADKINNILSSYQKCPPQNIGTNKVTNITNFVSDTVIDADGKTIPQQKFFFVTLDNNVQFAVRASGTEPKIKFYLFAEQTVSDINELPTVKQSTQQLLDEMKILLKSDTEERTSFSS